MKKTTRKEVVEEFDQSGKLITRTTTEETITEDNLDPIIAYPSPYTAPNFNDVWYSTTTKEINC